MLQRLRKTENVAEKIKDGIFWGNAHLLLRDKKVFKHVQKLFLRCCNRASGFAIYHTTECKDAKYADYRNLPCIISSKSENFHYF
jgi:hypothetical protein